MQHATTRPASIHPAPFVDPVADPSIDDYALIGNCRTAAMVSRFGSIDWWCLPDFAGPSLFASLLDRERGGRFALTPLHIRRVVQQYVERTNVLRTCFECSGGILELDDFMVMPEVEARRDARTADHEIVRIARCREGQVELQALYEPRPNYARDKPRLSRKGTGRWSCLAGDTEVELTTDLVLRPVGDHALGARVTMTGGQQCAARVCAPAQGARSNAPLAELAEDALAATIAWWRKWSQRCTHEGRFKKELMRSALVLKLLTYKPSGAVIAAATTSLPESDDGSRNWDYRFCWLRDTSLVLQAFMDIGYVEESAEFLSWLIGAAKRTRPHVQVLYDIHGGTHLQEHVVGSLSGYHGIGPVHAGNGASNQRQNDIYGEVLLTACEFVARGGRIDEDEKQLLAELADTACRVWRDPDQGIWEIRLPPRHNTHSKLMCWAALDRTLQLQPSLPVDAQHIATQRDAVRDDIEAHGFSRELNSYVGYYGGQAPDSSLLLIPRLGYVDANDPRMKGTVKHITEQLGVDGLLYRYPPGGGYDGVKGREHLFAICSFWWVDCLARQGRVDEATELYERLLELRNHAGLYAEEFTVHDKCPHGNFPQAFSHVGSITAALAIEESRRHGGHVAKA